jgi:hypothetical protein
MLVPESASHGLSGEENPRAATTSVPGAAISGFRRPSRVGPWLEDGLTRSASVSQLATEITRWPQASELTEKPSTLEPAEK